MYCSRQDGNRSQGSEQDWLPWTEQSWSVVFVGVLTSFGVFVENRDSLSFYSNNLGTCFFFEEEEEGSLDDSNFLGALFLIKLLI